VEVVIMTSKHRLGCFGARDLVDDEIAVEEGKAEIKALDGRPKELPAQLESADEPPPLLHPEMAELYRQKGNLAWMLSATVQSKGRRKRATSRWQV
jgi:hypothetical protein